MTVRAITNDNSGITREEGSLTEGRDAQASACALHTIQGIPIPPEPRNTRGQEPTQPEIRTLQFPDGVYVGEIKNGLMDEKRTYRFANGDVYKGEWQDGKIHGNGTYRFANGDVYEGEWQDGKMHGKGTFCSANGDVYKGEWQDCKRHGKGTFFYANGDVYEGAWEDCKMHGKGTYRFANGDVYEGEWQDGKRHGNGTYRVANGDVYEGEWQDGKRHGKGTYRVANGDVYEGEWQDDKRHGKGTRRFTNGDAYNGEWKNGAPCGKGTISCSLGNFHKYEVDSDAGPPSLGTPHFLKPLLGKGKVMNESEILHIIAKWLRRTPKYKEMADHLDSARRVFQGTQDAKTEATAILQNLQQGSSRLLPFTTQTHAMGLKLVPREPGFIDFEIFNSGEGLSEYHPHIRSLRSEKYQTMLRVRVPIENVTLERLEMVLNLERPFSSVQEAYEFILKIPGATQVTIPPESQIWQTEQKSENCALEWIFAYLKNSLGESDYRALRRELFTACLDEVDRGPYLSGMGLEQFELQRKIKKRSG